MLDNTVPSPYLCRPIEWGADIVVHSATKYIGGHGTTMGGVIVESGKFHWGNGKFPEITAPSPGYHGVIFHETFGDFGYTMKARMEIMRTFGPALSPINAWLLLQGLEIAARAHGAPLRECAGGGEVPERSPAGGMGELPGACPTTSTTRSRRSTCRKGASGLLNFGVKGGARAGERFIEAAQFMSHLANIGDAKTLVIHPASTTHRQMDEADQIKAGVHARHDPHVGRASRRSTTSCGISIRHSMRQPKHDLVPNHRAWQAVTKSFF